MKTQSRSSGHAMSGPQLQWPVFRAVSTTLIMASAAGREYTQTGTTAFRIPVPTPLIRRDMHIHDTFMALHWRAAPTIPHTEPIATPQIRPYLSPAQPPSKQPSRAPTKVSPGLVRDQRRAYQNSIWPQFHLPTTHPLLAARCSRRHIRSP
jgi:hypothetical protein